MTDTTIRRATLDDLDAIAPLFDAYRRFYHQPGDVDRARDFLRERMLHSESVVLLAQRDGTAAGFTQLYPLFSSARTFGDEQVVEQPPISHANRARPA